MRCLVTLRRYSSVRTALGMRRRSNLARQGRNQTGREWQVAWGKWQAKKSSRLATKFRLSSTEATEALSGLGVKGLSATEHTEHCLKACGISTNGRRVLIFPF